MTLKKEAEEALSNFENTKAFDILETLTKIKSHLKSEITQEYLQGKIQAIHDIASEQERKKQCKNLKPYLEWYLQGA